MSDTDTVLKDTVVTLNYSVRDSDNNLLDDGAEPLVYLHGGYDGIFPLLEEHLHEKKLGDKLHVKLQPEDAFGDYDAELVLIEDIGQFPDNIEVGMGIERVGDDEETVYRITDIEDSKVVLDGNHPWAGIALVFDMEIAEIRPASAEETAHGHVHGAGGHHY